MRIEKSIEIRAGAPAVWRALTDPDITKQYYFGCEAISDWEVGSPVSYSTEEDGNRTVHVKGTVKECEPNRRLTTTCIASGFENDPAKETEVTYTLSGRGEVTELAVIHSGFHDQEEFARNKGSWDIVLNGLKAVVEGLEANR